MRPPPAEVSENGLKARITKSLTGPPSPPGPLRRIGGGTLKCLGGPAAGCYGRARGGF